MVQIVQTFVQQKFLGQFLSMITTIQQISAASGKLSMEAVTNLVAVIARLRDIGDAIQGMVSLKGVLTNFVNTQFLNTLLTSVKVVEAISKSTGKTSITQIDNFRTTIDAISKIGTTISVGDLRQTTKVMNEIAKILNSVVQYVIKEGVINEFIAVGLAFQRISTAFERIVTVVRGMKVGFLGHNAELSAASALLKQFTKIIVDVINQVFNPSQSIFQKLRGITPQAADSAQIEALARLVSATARAMEQVVAAVKKIKLTSGTEFVGALTAFKTLQTGLKMIINVMQDQRTLLQRVFGKGAQPADAAQLEALAKLIASMSSILGKVFTSLNRFSGSRFDMREDTEKNIKTKIKFIQDLMNQFKGFRGKDLPDNLVRLLTKVPPLIAALSAVGTQDVGKAGNLSSMKNASKALIDFFNAIKKIDPKKAAALGDLGAAIRALGSIKKVQDIAGLIESVNQLVTIVNKTKIDRRAFADLRIVADEVGKAFQGLNKINVNETQVGALRALIDTYSKLSRTEIPPIAKTLVDVPATQQAGQLTGKTFAKSVQKGVFSAGIRLMVVKYFVDLVGDIAKLFNPLVLFAALRSGIQTVLDFARQIGGVFTNLSSRVQQLGQQLQQLGDRMTNIGRQINQRFGIGALISGQAFTNAADFEQLLTQVQVYGNLSVEALERVRKAAVQVGIDFPQTAAEALQAGLNLIKNGLNAQQTEFALPVIAALTNLSDSKNMDTISMGVTQIVNSFDKLTPGIISNWENASTVADILSSAADTSSASVEDLLQGFTNVGPLANQMGLDVQQTAAILSIFADNGLRGAEAGTALKSIFTNMNTSTARNELKSLGVSLTDEAGNFRNFNDIVNDLQNALLQPKTVQYYPPGASPADRDALELATKAYASAQRQLLVYSNDLQTADLSEEERNKKLDQYQSLLARAQTAIDQYSGSQQRGALITREITRTQEANVQAIQKLGGRYGQIGLSILLNQDTDAIQNFTDRMDQMPPAVQRALQMLDNFKGSAEQLSGSVETLTINAFVPLLETFFRPFVEVLRTIVDSLLRLDPMLQEAGGWFVALGSTLATLVGSGLIVSGVLTKIGGGVIRMAGALLNFRGFIRGFVAVLGAMTTGFVALVAVIAPIALLLTGISLAVSTMHKVIVDNLGGAGDAFELLRFHVKLSMGVIGGVLGTIIDFIKTLFFGSAETGGASLANVGTLFGVVFSMIAGQLSKAEVKLASFGNALRGLTSALSSLFLARSVADQSFVYQSLVDNPVIGWIFERKGVPISAQTVQTFLSTLRRYRAELAVGFVDISNAVSTFVSNLTHGKDLNTALETLRGDLEVGFGKVAASMLRIIGAVFNINFDDVAADFDVGNLSDGIDKIVTRIKKSITTWITDHQEDIANVATGLFATFFLPGALAETVAGWVGMDNVKTTIHDLRTTIEGGFKGLVNTVLYILQGDDVATALRKSFGPGIEPVLKFASELGKTADNILGILGAIVNGIFNPGVKEGKGKNLGDLLAEALGGASDALEVVEQEHPRSA